MRSFLSMLVQGSVEQEANYQVAISYDSIQVTSVVFVSKSRKQGVFQNMLNNHKHTLSSFILSWRTRKRMNGCKIMPGRQNSGIPIP